MTIQNVCYALMDHMLIRVEYVNSYLNSAFIMTLIMEFVYNVMIME